MNEVMNEVLSTPKLDEFLPRYKRETILRILKLLTGKIITQREKAVQGIKTALKSPETITSYLKTLDESSLQILAEVKRNGGAMDGWGIIAFARLRGLEQPTKRFHTYSADYEGVLGDFKANNFEYADYILSMVENGLLMPVALPNAWFPYSAKYDSTPIIIDNPKFFSWFRADPRILEQLSDQEAIPLIKKPVAVSITIPDKFQASPRGILPVLELVRGIQSIGSLSFTKTGEFAKASLSRLKKAGPTLENNLESRLIFASQLELLSSQHSPPSLTVNTEQLNNILSLSAEQLNQLLLSRSAIFSWPEDNQYKVAYLHELRAALMEVLRELPHPSTETYVLEALKIATPPLLRRVKADISYASRKQPSSDDYWVDWTRALLRGTFTDLGLVRVIDREGAPAVIVPSPKLHQILSNHPADRQNNNVTKTSPAAPAWIVQPNFEILVYPQHLQANQLRVLQAAEALRFDPQTATYRLTRETVYAALENGLDLEELLQTLSEGSAMPLASSLQRTLRDWASRRDRITLYQNVTVMEYPDAQQRDAAMNMAGMAGGTAVADALLILPIGKKTPAGTPIFKYNEPPQKRLTFKNDGRFSIEGNLDLVSRQLLSGRVSPTSKSATEPKEEPTEWQFIPMTAGTLPRTFALEVEQRTLGKLPSTLRLQLGVWSGLTEVPAMGMVSLVQHSQAQALSQHPKLKPLIDTVLSPQFLTIKAGKEAEFKAELEVLGLAPSTVFSSPSGTPAALPITELVFMTDTRKKREFLEEALRNNQTVLVQYQEEKRSNSWYGSDISPGKQKQEEVVPLSVDRSGSTPYLIAKLLASGKEVTIRIQYIMGMALR